VSDDYVSIIVPTLDTRDVVDEHLSRIARAGADRIELILVCAPHVAISEEELLGYGFRSPKVIMGLDVSQPDAVNLGAHVATGSLITWLNPGDGLRPATIASIQQALHASVETGVIYGRSELYRGQSSVGEYPVGSVVTPETLFQACCISQPAAWISRSAWLTLGGVRPVFDCAFDYDLWIRAVRRGIKFTFLNEVIAEVDISPVSKSFSRRADVFQEQCEVLLHHYGRCPPGVLTAMWAEALAPAEGYQTVAAELLRQAVDSLKMIGHTAEKAGDHHTILRLQTDARLHFLSRGVAIECQRDGYLSQSGRMRISADRLPMTLLFQLDRQPDTIDDVAILVQPDQEPARCTLLSSMGCLAARIEPEAGFVEDGFVTLSFLSTSDLGARLISAW
jgi:hypothetical protein